MTSLSLRQRLLLLTPIAVLFVALPAQAYPYWKVCGPGDRLRPMSMEEAAWTQVLQSRSGDTSADHRLLLEGARVECEAELEARFSYLNFSSEHARGAIASSRADAASAWSKLPESIRSLPLANAEVARALVDVQACQQTIEAIPADSTVVVSKSKRFSNRLMIFYPYYNQFAYISGYRRNANTTFFYPPILKNVEKALYQSLQMGLDPQVGFAVSANETPGRLDKTESGVHAFHLMNVLACGKRSLESTAVVGEDGKLRTAYSFKDSDLSSRILSALEYPATAIGSGKSYLCAGKTGKTTRLMELEQSFRAEATPDATAQCCLELPASVASMPEEVKKNAEDYFRRIFAFQYLKNQIASLNSPANKNQRQVAKAEIIERFLSLGHGILGSGAGFLISPVRLGINTNKDPLYGYQAMDYITQSFSNHPYLRDAQTRLEGVTGKRVPNYLCVGEETGPLEIETTDFTKRIYNSKRMTFLPGPGGDPSALRDNALSVFYYELKNSKAVVTRMVEILGQSAYSDAMEQLARRGIRWARTLFSPEQIEVYQAHLPVVAPISGSADEARVRNAIRILFNAYMGDPELFAARKTYGTASKQDSLFPWDRHGPVRSREFGNLARIRGVVDSRFEPMFAPHLVTEEQNFRPVSSEAFGAPGDPVIVKAENREILATYLGQGSNGQTIFKTRSNGNSIQYALGREDLTAYSVRKVERTDLSGKRYYIEDLNRIFLGEELAKDPLTGWIYPIVDVGSRSRPLAGYSNTRVIEIREDWADTQWDRGGEVCFGNVDTKQTWKLAEKLVTDYAVLESFDLPATFVSISWDSLAECVDPEWVKNLRPIDPSQLENRVKKPKKKTRGDTIWAFRKDGENAVSLGRVYGTNSDGSIVFSVDSSSGARKLRGKRMKKSLRSISPEQVILFSFDTSETEIQVWLAKGVIQKSEGVSIGALGSFLGELKDGRWIVKRNGSFLAIRLEDGYVKIRRPGMQKESRRALTHVSAQNVNGEWVDAVWMGEDDEKNQVVVFGGKSLQILRPSQVR